MRKAPLSDVLQSRLHRFDSGRRLPAPLLQAFPHGCAARDRLALRGALVTRTLVTPREKVARKARPGGDDKAENREPVGNRRHAPSIGTEPDVLAPCGVAEKSVVSRS
jgi:hypothetical protein